MQLSGSFDSTCYMDSTLHPFYIDQCQNQEIVMNSSIQFMIIEREVAVIEANPKKLAN